MGTCLLSINKHPAFSSVCLHIPLPQASGLVFACYVKQAWLCAITRIRLLWLSSSGLWWKVRYLIHGKKKWFFSILPFPDASTTMGRKSHPDSHLSLLPVYVIWASNTYYITCWCQCPLPCPAHRTCNPRGGGVLVSNAGCSPRAPIHSKFPEPFLYPNTEVSLTYVHAQTQWLVSDKRPRLKPNQQHFSDCSPMGCFHVCPPAVWKLWSPCTTRKNRDGKRETNYVRMAEGWMGAQWGKMLSICIYFH